MPLYDYKCVVCGHEEEHVIPMASSSEPITCEKCGMRSERIITFRGAFTNLETPGSSMSRG